MKSKRQKAADSGQKAEGDAETRRRGDATVFFNSKFKIQNSKLSPLAPRPSLTFRWLLPLTLGFSLLLCLLLLHVGQAIWSLWQAHFNQPGTLLPLPGQFRPSAVWQIVKGLLLPQTQLPVPFLGAALVLVGVIAFLVYPRRLLNAIAAILSVGFGFILAAHWDKLLLSIHPTAFQATDPLFDKDIGFYLFSLPLWELAEFWLTGILLYSLMAVALIYLLAGESLGSAWFPGFSLPQRRHLSGLGGGLVLVIGLSYWLSRYELLYSPRGVTFGASYTDVSVQLPANTGLSLLAVAIASFLLWRAFLWKPQRQRRFFQPSKRAKQPSSYTLIVFLGYLAIAVTLGSIVPIVVQRLVVQPNELAREQPFIQHTIALTRKAFDLEDIDVETFDPQNALTYADLQKNELTVRNIRLWDTRPLLETNRQLQQIRLYYRFFDADIDRYTIKAEGRGQKAEGRRQEAEVLPLGRQQVLIAARELDYGAVPDVAKTWVNEHLVYTHGYGFTLTPVNKVAPGGLPDYFVRDIGTEAGTPGAGRLITSSEQIRASIPIGYPRIYFGEITDTYIMTNTKVQELDYPSGNDNIYNIYDGLGGVDIGSLWQRWLFAIYLRDWQMVFTDNFNAQTKLLFRRNINQRIRAIAPFLTYDQDPYLVVADAGAEAGRQKAEGRRQEAEGKNSKLKTQNSKLTQNYLYWIVDAYTTSDRYPYSAPAQHLSPGQSGSFNYIRNSVKVVIDAYNGSVNFYVADADDPIIQSWSAIFPGLFKPLSAMPAALQEHIRYPQDLFRVQSEQLMVYHMTDPQVFYNREDQWQVPTEIYDNKPQLVEPYYLIMNLPTTTKAEEFILLLPYTPKQRTNLTAWLASRSDGKDYGTSLLYRFPKQQLVFGTQQIEARINQDPVISQQISLWNRQGSRAVQGNLLVIPIDQSLLYVEPLYLEAAQNSLPTLVRVIVAYENRIVMAETLEQALRAVFQPQKPTTPAIVRPVVE
ncbi:UPF0182 family protein [Kovacikia minuta CCNUW1]|uniref:UPF0182 family protein n=1 Tax=Kovacikia minuta TaxID=2931930 RepID=UPI001CCA64C9|nr:UPF0182 family protein [Kovacikia minuta]UBF23624.1 UPF0182 family protein [Kovacikia minuta CCNUW1]